MPNYTIPNLVHACRVLKHLGETDQPMTVGELAKRLTIPRTSCLRIVQTLLAEGLLVERAGGVLLGSVLVSLGAKALQAIDLAALAGPVLQDLTASVGETSHVAVWNDGRVLIAAVCDSPHPLRAASRPGATAQAHCSSTGKVLLAYNHLEQLDETVPRAAREKRTARTMVDTPSLKRELRQVLVSGYAVDDEEYHPGVRCVAAPVRDAGGQVCAAIGITASAARFPKSATAKVAAIVQKHAQRLSKQLGAR